MNEDSPKWAAENGRPKTYGLTRQQMFPNHVPAFLEGLIIGSREWVEARFERNREFFGPKRKTGARRIAGLADPFLWTIRQKPPLVAK